MRRDLRQGQFDAHGAPVVGHVLLVSRSDGDHTQNESAQHQQQQKRQDELHPKTRIKQGEKTHRNTLTRTRTRTHTHTHTHTHADAHVWIVKPTSLAGDEGANVNVTMYYPPGHPWPTPTTLDTSIK
jgi:hypothetical protein